MSYLFLGNAGTRITLKKLNGSYCGCFFFRVPASDGLDMKRMNFIYCGAPFVAYAKG